MGGTMRLRLVPSTQLRQNQSRLGPFCPGTLRRGCAATPKFLKAIQWHPAVQQKLDEWPIGVSIKANDRTMGDGNVHASAQFVQDVLDDAL